MIMNIIDYLYVNVLFMIQSLLQKSFSVIYGEKVSKMKCMALKELEGFYEYKEL
jgi:hypothetical protein